jgi:hypothetical protein
MVSVYVSYAWKEEEQNRLVDKLEQACAARGIDLRYDKKAMRYGDSIRQFMDEIGTAEHVVLLLSEAYLKSRYCMDELCRIYGNGDFRRRVNPIVLSETRFHHVDEHSPYTQHWEDERKALRAKIKSHSEPERALEEQKELKEVCEILRLMPEILSALADMNTLTENVHLETDFAALLARIAPEERKDDGGGGDGREADEIFVARVEGEVRRALAEVHELTRMIRQHAVAKGLPDGDDLAGLARWLCTSRLETVLDDVLRPATRSALPRKTAHAIRESDVWEAAKSLLFWLSVLAVRPDWVRAQEVKEAGGESRFEVFVRTACGAEIVSSRYRQVRPGFRAGRGLHVDGQGQIELSDLESGFNDAQAIEGILLDVAKHFGEHSGGPLLDTKQKELIRDLVRDALEDDEKHKTGHHYILVDTGEDSPLRRRAVYDGLRELLPRLKIIYLQPSGEETPLLLQETRLITIIRGFLTLPDALR